MRSVGVLPLIIQLLQSNNDEVRFGACWALTSSAFDHGVAIDYCKHGYVKKGFNIKSIKWLNFLFKFSAIELLRDLNQSSQRKSSFTDTALKKLLEANLSAKYALTNHLG